MVAQDATDLKRRSMLKSLIHEMAREGIIVTHAAMQGYEPPHAVGRYRPDVIGEYPDGRRVIGIVRMGGEDIDSAAGRQQIKDLATRITQTHIRDTHARHTLRNLKARTVRSQKDSVPLYIAIPAKARHNLADTLKEIGLEDQRNIRVRTY